MTDQDAGGRTHAVHAFMQATGRPHAGDDKSADRCGRTNTWGEGGAEDADSHGAAHRTEPNRTPSPAHTHATQPPNPFDRPYCQQATQPATHLDAAARERVGPELSLKAEGQLPPRLGRRRRRGVRGAHPLRLEECQAVWVGGWV
jgi:hypothetical protein